MSKKTEVIKGDKYGRLEIIEETTPRISTRLSRMIFCKCICGKIIKTSLNSLRMGHTKSCGCISEEQNKKGGFNFKHGHTKSGGKQSKLYMVWSSMKNRCKNSKDKSFKNYGGRGIIVCDRWLDSFNNFLEDMGEPNKGRSLDRINNDKGYYKENCRWATNKEQANNTRQVKKIEYNGKILSQVEWSKKLGGNVSLIQHRIKRGESPQQAVSRPPRLKVLLNQ